MILNKYLVRPVQKRLIYATDLNFEIHALLDCRCYREIHTK